MMDALFEIKVQRTLRREPACKFLRILKATGAEADARGICDEAWVIFLGSKCEFHHGRQFVRQRFRSGFIRHRGFKEPQT